MATHTDYFSLNTPRLQRPTLARNPTTWTPGEVSDYVARPTWRESFRLEPLYDIEAQRLSGPAPHIPEPPEPPSYAQPRRPSTVHPRAVPFLGWSIPSRWQVTAITIAATSVLIGLSQLSLAASNRTQRLAFEKTLPDLLKAILTAEGL